MARLPTPGGDSGQWGAILNEFLTTSHSDNGTIKKNAGVVREDMLAAALRTKLNVSSTFQGDVQGPKSATVVQAINGITVTGTPSAGRVLKAVSPTAAAWLPEDTFGSVVIITSDYTASDGQNILADCSDGDITVTLPAPQSGIKVTVKRIGDGYGGMLTVTTPSGVIDGNASWQTEELGEAQIFVSNGTDWFLLNITFTTQPPDPPESTAVRWAGDFLNATGVNTHFMYHSIVDNIGIDGQTSRGIAAMGDMVEYLGVRNVRSDVKDAWSINAVNALYERGIRTMIMMKLLPRANPTDAQIRTGTDEDLDLLREHSSWIGGAVNGLENINEIDNDQASPQQFPRVARTGMPYTWTQSADLRGDGLVVGSMSLIGYKLGDSFGDAAKIEKDSAGDNMAKWFDFGAYHAYASRHNVIPETSYPDATWQTADFPPGSAPTGKSNTPLKILQYFSWYVSKAKPLRLTEFNRMDESMESSSILLPRWMLENFRIGVHSFYIYQLFHDGTESGSFGLYQRKTAGDNTSYRPTPKAVAVHNLTHLLADNATSYTPTALDYTATGPDSLRKILFQKSNGEYWLALWLALPVVDANNNPINRTKQDVTVAFTGGSRTVQLYPDLSMTPGTAQGPVSSFTFQIGPEISFVKIT